MGVDKVNVRFNNHSDETAPVDRFIGVHWANAPGGEIWETHDLTRAEWKDLHDETVANDRTDFETKLEAAWASPADFTWGTTTGDRVMDAAWQSAKDTWTPTT